MSPALALRSRGVNPRKHSQGSVTPGEKPAIFFDWRGVLFTYKIEANWFGLCS